MNNQQTYDSRKTGVPCECPSCGKDGIWSPTGLYCNMGCFYDKIYGRDKKIICSTCGSKYVFSNLLQAKCCPNCTPKKILPFFMGKILNAFKN